MHTLEEYYFHDYNNIVPPGTKNGLDSTIKKMWCCIIKSSTFDYPEKLELVNAVSVSIISQFVRPSSYGSVEDRKCGDSRVVSTYSSFSYCPYFSRSKYISMLRKKIIRFVYILITNRTECAQKRTLLNILNFVQCFVVAYWRRFPLICPILKGILILSSHTHAHSYTYRHFSCLFQPTVNQMILIMTVTCQL